MFWTGQKRGTGIALSLTQELASSLGFARLDFLRKDTWFPQRDGRL
jgi:hypothetical protein